MIRRSLDAAFGRFQRTRDARALGRVFDRAAPELLRLARHLAPEPSVADDLVQDTFLTAIEAVEQFDPTRATLPWLVGILANHARVARRRSRRAIDPRRLRSSSSQHGADPAAVAASSETRAVLETTIDRLSEPTRIVLRLHLFDGLEPTEIAQRLERQGGTVRSQLSRGLEELRRNLPRDVLSSPTRTRGESRRNLRALRAAVLAHHFPSFADQGGALTSAGVWTIMNKKLIVSVAAVLLIAGVWFAVVTRDRGAATTDHSASTAIAQQRSDATAAGDGGVAHDDSAAVDTPTRSAVADAESSEPEAVPSQPTLGSLRVAVRYGSSGAPAAGQRVLTIGRQTMPAFAERLAAPTTDAHGVVTIEGLSPGDWVVQLADRGQREFARVRAGERTDLEIVLRGATIFGTVHDANGAAVAGAQISLHDGSGGSSIAGVSDGTGSFECFDVPPGAAVQAQKAGQVASLIHPIQAKAGTRARIDLVLRGAARRLVGRVLDSTGRPEPRALVGVLSREDDAAMRVFDRVAPRPTTLFVFADESGRFETDIVAQSPLLVAAASSDNASEAAFGAAEVAAGETDAFVEVVLPRGGSITGLVQKDSAPVAGAMIVAWLREPRTDIGHMLNLLGNFQASTDAAGHYELGRLPPGTYEVRVHGSTLTANRDITLEVGQRVAWNPGADGSGSMSIAVTVAATAVSIGARASGLGYVVLLRPSQQESATNAAVSMTLTGYDGRCRFDGLTHATHDVQVMWVVGGNPQNMVLCAERDDIATVGETELTIELGADDAPSAQLTGRVLVDGLAAQNARAIALRRHSRFAAEIEIVVDEAGRFSIGPLPPGDYALRIESADRSRTRELEPRSLRPGQLDDLGDIELAR